MNSSGTVSRHSRVELPCVKVQARHHNGCCRESLYQDVYDLRYGNLALPTERSLLQYSTTSTPSSRYLTQCRYGLGNAHHIRRIYIQFGYEGELPENHRPSASGNSRWTCKVISSVLQGITTAQVSSGYVGDILLNVLNCDLIILVYISAGESHWNQGPLRIHIPKGWITTRKMPRI